MLEIRRRYRKCKFCFSYMDYVPIRKKINNQRFSKEIIGTREAFSKSSQDPSCCTTCYLRFKDDD